MPLRVSRASRAMRWSMQLAAQAPGDEVQIGARGPGARGERAGKPVANLVEPLQQGRKKRLRLGPTASGQLESLAASARAPRQAMPARGAGARRAEPTARREPARRSRPRRSASERDRSAAKSIKVVSVSWPTAEISGIGNSAAARTTSSSLNGHKSSIEPPPRATISRSGRGSIDGKAADRLGDPGRTRPPPGPAPATG